MTQGKRPAWVKWVVLGCLGMIIVAFCLAAGVVAIVMGGLKQSDAYKGGLAAVRENRAAVEALGEPIEGGFFLSGSVNVTGPSGEAVLAVPLSGPRAKGTLYLEATKRAGRWEYSLLELAVDGEAERIELLPKE
jgi:hypothetical protein